MTRRDHWFSERPQRPPAEYASLMAGDRFWRDERLRLIGTHPEFPDAATVLLKRDEELAHALLLVLSRLPKQQRRPFADAFYVGARPSPHGDLDRPHPREAAASIALLALELTGRPELMRDPIHDLLVGAAQGDDLTRTPEPVVAELQRTIARIRFDVDADDLSDPERVAATAIAEVLDPSSDVPDVKEILARVAFAAFETWGPERTLALLREIDRFFGWER